jgi:hypothetical protein
MPRTWKFIPLALTFVLILGILRDNNVYAININQPGNKLSSVSLTNTVIPRCTSNRFTSFRLYEMHKLIPVFQFTIHFSFIQAPSSRKPTDRCFRREVMGNKFSFCEFSRYEQFWRNELSS